VLRQLAVAKTRPIRSITGYQAMLLLTDAAEHLLVHLAMEPEDEILRADRVRRDPEPPCPPIVQPWVDREPGSLDEPSIRDCAVPPGPVTTEFAAWLRPWRPWAAEERRLPPPRLRR